MKLLKTAAVTVALIFSASVSAQIVYIPDFPVKKAAAETQTTQTEQQTAAPTQEQKAA